MNKVSGGDGIPIELFQILKDDAVKVHSTQYASKFGKLSSGHRTGKGVVRSGVPHGPECGAAPRPRTASGQSLGHQLTGQR